MKQMKTKHKIIWNIALFFILQLTNTMFSKKKSTCTEQRWSRIIRKMCDVLRDLVPFKQFQKREKHPWRSVTFILEVTLVHGYFSRFLNCTNCTKSRNLSQVYAIFRNNHVKKIGKRTWTIADIKLHILSIIK